VRRDWGADESLGRHTDGSLIWPAAFEPVVSIVLHHTHGRNDDADPARTIREIHRFHTLDRGWGDIGYNFLIDESGAIYEGRSSAPECGAFVGENAAGWGVVGAHAKSMNRGSVGIGLLGTFTDRRPTAAAVDAVRDLVAWQVTRHGIEVTAADAIRGHGDVADTSCPGWGVREILDGLRHEVAEIVGR
jgi:hypothetical protein